MELRRGQFRMRPWRVEDRAAFAALNAEPEMARYLSPFTPGKSDAMLERIVAHFVQHEWGYWALEERQSGNLIGLCGLMHVPFEAFFTPAVEISWRLSRKWQGQGLAREAAQAALGFGFESLELDRVVAFTVTGNAASWGLMQRLGMRKIGEFDNAEFPEGHPLRRNVVYEIGSSSWRLLGVGLH
ncbi:MAG TPA: GNAT family N-acetyltransferase [Dongiaceae bacterium]|nr:GNAT family N-acetyltransferase [Dongiaceae bacterium]